MRFRTRDFTRARRTATFGGIGREIEYSEISALVLAATG
jgi:hypothetical protein